MAVTSNEATPLLAAHQDVETPTAGRADIAGRNKIYDRFDPAAKRHILGIVSIGGFLPLTVGWSFVPSIPQIARDLGSIPSVVSLGVSVSILASAVGAISGATYAGFYGRRAVYLYSLPVLLLGSIGVASSFSVRELMVWRFIQALGCAPGGAVGAGVIGDIYRLEERGRAMSVFFAACLIGPTLSPLMGGLAAHYSSWRIFQLCLGLIGLAMWVLVLLFLPETSHPGSRTIEKVSNAFANADSSVLVGSEEAIPSSQHCVRTTCQWPTWRPVLLNPFAPLWLLRSPALLSIALVTACSLWTYQVLLIPLAYTLGARYEITNEALIGACFFAAGMGNLVGTPIVGHISDMTVIKWRQRRNGVWYPEDRLRPALFPLCTLVPFSCVASGLLSTYGSGRIGLAFNLFCLFLNGLGLEMVWGPCAAYLVDVNHSQSAETMASNAALRQAIVSVGVGSILPMINTYGVVFTNAAAAAVSLVGFILLACTVRYGERLRGLVDVGFSTADTN